VTKPPQGSRSLDLDAANWVVEFHDDFDKEFDSMAEDVQDALLSAAKALQSLGPHAGRPYVDTLKGSKHANMKELRFAGHDGSEEWRAAFAFDPARRAIILVAGDKQGKSETRFYRKLIAKADERFDAHLRQIMKLGRGRKG
jgi:hypothetical protein